MKEIKNIQKLIKTDKKYIRILMIKLQNNVHSIHQ